MTAFPQKKAGNETIYIFNTAFSIEPVKFHSEELFIMAAYDSMNLKKYGLSKEAFRYAYKGYINLKKKKLITKKDIFTICDFSQSSKRKRLYLIDIENLTVVMNTYVAHGKRSGVEYANRFSNKPNSHQSSLGFYITRNTYYGEHGLSLVIDGVEKGINDKAERRRIVVHGSNYIGDTWKNNGNMGRSFGCPAVPKKQSLLLINAIKNGSCLFIYHPDKKYLTGSTILKG